MRVENMHARAVVLAIFVCIVTLVPVASGNAAPATGSTPAEFIEVLADQAIATLTVDSISREERVARFRTLLRDNFAIPSIGRWVLGRYWGQTSEAERSEYLTLFENLIVATYVDQFAAYAGEKLSVVRSSDVGEGDVMVQTLISRPNGIQPIGVGWRVRRHNDRFWIVDVMAEGISMGQTQRAEFASVIRRNGGKVEGLLAELRKGPAGAMLSRR